jgi:DinB superfamily
MVATASAMVDEYDAVMAEAIALAESCSDDEWRTICVNEQRAVGVLFDHIASGNPEVVRWIKEFLAGQPIVITPEILNSRNAEHAHQVHRRPRAETIDDLKRGTATTSEFLDSLTKDQLGVRNEFGWAGPQDVAWVASAALRHPRGHLKSIREALGR